MKDIRQTPKYANHLSNLGWKVENVQGVYIFSKNIPLLGNVLKIQRPEKITNSILNSLLKRKRIFNIIIEPKDTKQTTLLKECGFKISKNPYLPTKTLILNLDTSKDKLFKNLKKDARYSINKTKSIKITKTDNLEGFRSTWKNAVGLKRHVPGLTNLLSLNKSFGKYCAFFLAGDKSAGAIFLISDKTAYYWQAFTNKYGRRSLSQYKVVWEAILWSKTLGAKRLDFEGVYDERFPNKSWVGFSHFKESFGGKPFKYPGCYTKSRLIKW